MSRLYITLTRPTHCAEGLSFPCCLNTRAAHPRAKCPSIPHFLQTIGSWFGFRGRGSCFLSKRSSRCCFGLRRNDSFDALSSASSFSILCTRREMASPPSEAAAITSSLAYMCNFSGSLDSVERWNGMEWWNGIVERWNSGMVE